jgi:hypothetical protein
VAADSLAVVRHTRRAALTLLALGVIALLIVGANGPANPELVPAQGIVKERAFHGFGAVDVTVIAGPGLSRAAWPRCALLASSSSQRAHGLMGQRSVADFVGMVFAFTQPVTERFYMKKTPVALSIAWFDRRGRFVGAADMPPCPDRVTQCPTYGPSAPYQLAIEVPHGRLGPLGIGPGSTLQLGTPCIG